MIVHSRGRSWPIPEFNMSPHDLAKHLHNIHTKADAYRLDLPQVIEGIGDAYITLDPENDTRYPSSTLNVGCRRAYRRTWEGIRLALAGVRRQDGRRRRIRSFWRLRPGPAGGIRWNVSRGRCGIPRMGGRQEIVQGTGRTEPTHQGPCPTGVRDGCKWVCSEILYLLKPWDVRKRKAGIHRQGASSSRS